MERSWSTWVLASASPAQRPRKRQPDVPNLDGASPVVWFWRVPARSFPRRLCHKQKWIINGPANSMLHVFATRTSGRREHCPKGGPSLVLHRMVPLLGPISCSPESFSTGMYSAILLTTLRQWCMVKRTAIQSIGFGPGFVPCPTANKNVLISWAVTAGRASCAVTLAPVVEH